MATEKSRRMERNRPASDGVRAFDPAQCMPLLEELLRECISAVGKEPEAMKKTDRMRIIRMLYKRRAFTYQKSVAIVAERLNVSRYTVYKYMHELEEAEAAGSLVQD